LSFYVVVLMCERLSLKTSYFQLPCVRLASFTPGKMLSPSNKRDSMPSVHPYAMQYLLIFYFILVTAGNQRLR